MAVEVGSNSAWGQATSAVRVMEAEIPEKSMDEALDAVLTGINEDRAVDSTAPQHK